VNLHVAKTQENNLIIILTAVLTSDLTCYSVPLCTKCNIDEVKIFETVEVNFWQLFYAGRFPR
jgi:hypothetical protein